MDSNNDTPKWVNFVAKGLIVCHKGVCKATTTTGKGLAKTLDLTTKSIVKLNNKVNR